MALRVLFKRKLLEEEEEDHLNWQFIIQQKDPKERPGGRIKDWGLGMEGKQDGGDGDRRKRRRKEGGLVKAKRFPLKRIHMITGKLVGVLNEPFFIKLHNDLLPTDCTDIV